MNHNIYAFGRVLTHSSIRKYLDFSVLLMVFGNACLHYGLLDIS